MKKIVLAILSSLTVCAGVVFFLKKESGQIVLLNGTSASGKTSIIKELQKIYGDSYVPVIGDNFLKAYEIDHPMPESMQLNEYQRQVLDAIFLHVKQLSLSGKNVFVEVVDFDDNYDHYCSILNCDNIVKILVYSPLDVVAGRVEKRNKSGDQPAYLNSSIHQFKAIYKLQESADEVIVDRIDTSRIQYALQIAKREVCMLMKEAGVKEEDFETNINLFAKPFVDQFKLDILKEVVLVPKHKWDLVVNSSTYSPMQIAELISEYLERR